MIEQYYHIVSTEYSAIGWLLILAIFLLTLSAFLHGYYHIFHTTSLRIFTFAKTSSLVIGFIAILMIILATDWWWGFAGAVGYITLFLISLLIWRSKYVYSNIAERIQNTKDKKQCVRTVDRN